MLKGHAAEAYNVANPDGECSIAELADRLAAAFHHEKITVERRHRTDSVYVPSPVLSTMPNVDKLKRLGWQASWSIEEGFKRTVESYRQPSA